MNKIFLFLFTQVLFLSCSSKPVFNSDDSDREIDKALEGLEQRKEVDYGPTLNDSNLQFIDKAQEYGLGGVNASSLMLVDLNFDGHSDLVTISDYFSQASFYLYDPKAKKFNLISSLFDNPIKSSFIVFADFNKDGITDALSGVLNQKTELSQKSLRYFKGIKKDNLIHFEEDKSFINIPPMPTATIALIDYNLDGYLDIFVGNWFESYKNNSIASKDILLIYEKGKYIDASELLEDENQKNPSGSMYVNATPTYGAQVCDIDKNGFPDILTTSTNGFQNKLWLNRYKVREEKRYFKNYGVETNYGGDKEGNLTSRGGGRSFGLACADYNNDGIFDVFVGESSHNYDSDLVDKSSILTGASQKFPPRFIRTEYVLDAYDLDWSESDKRGIWFDYNNDGLLDLMVDNSGFPPHTRLLLFKQLDDHSFINVNKDVGIDIVNPLSTVVLDINKDGYLDILTSQSSLRDSRINPRLYLFENRGSLEKTKTLRAYLNGKNANTDGLNATLELRVKNKNGYEIRTQVVSYSYGGLSPQNEKGVNFSMRAQDEILSLKIVWPYSKSVNNNRAGMEKFYNLKNLSVNELTEITFCENGRYLIGIRECK
tara:strand:- start:35657 stop:37456 length:1800 start_codon:yes stop_codon:yes gene_type:complete